MQGEEQTIVRILHANKLDYWLYFVSDDGKKPELVESSSLKKLI